MPFSNFKQTWFKHVCRLVRLLVRIPFLQLPGSRRASGQYLWNYNLEYPSTFPLSSWHSLEMKPCVWKCLSYGGICTIVNQVFVSKIHRPPRGGLVHGKWENLNKQLLMESMIIYSMCDYNQAPTRNVQLFFSFSIFRCCIAVLE